MYDTLESMGRKKASATKVKSVVSNMKLMAASSILQFERAVFNSDCYCKNIELGLVSCLKKMRPHIAHSEIMDRKVVAIILGTDVGLVGPFNEHLAQQAKEKLIQKNENKLVIAVGERMSACLQNAQVPITKKFACPLSIEAIAPFVIKVLSEIEEYFSDSQVIELVVFHHRSSSTKEYEPVITKILPFTEAWEERLALTRWPTHQIPELIEQPEKAFLFLLKEYVFILLARACAESINCENLSRFFCMQRAEKNIDEFIFTLQQDFHLLRQNSIDAELFDVQAGFSSVMNEFTINR